MIGTVFIVDDEAHTRKTLIRMIESGRMRWKVVGEAASGLEALEKMEEAQPNLVISDIRMPLMDGIQLASEIFERKWGMSVILLTAYQDFSYAQSAFRYGVKDFLLKPCPEEEVLRVLHREYELLLAKERQKKEAQQHALRAMMLRLPYNADTLQELRDSLLQSELWLLKVEDYLPESKNYRPCDLDLLQFSIRNIIEEMFGIRALSAYILHLQQHIFAVFLQGSADEESGASLYSTLFQEVERTIEGILGIAMQCRKYGSVQVLEELAGIQETMDSIGPGNDILLKLQDNARTLEIKAIAETMQSEMMSLLIMGDVPKLRLRLDSALAELDGLTLPEAKLASFAISIALQQMMQKELDVPVADDTQQQISELYRLEEMAEIIDWVTAKGRQFLDRLQQWIAERNQTLIKQAIRYMEQNYMHSCQLADVSSHIHLSPKYFSEFFKLQTGVNFMEYLTGIRMEKAKMLLRNTEMAIAGIAREVGYDDPNYFSTVFKKKYKQTPVQFRKLPDLLENVEE